MIEFVRHCPLIPTSASSINSSSIIRDDGEFGDVDDCGTAGDLTICICTDDVVDLFNGIEFRCSVDLLIEVFISDIVDCIWDDEDDVVDIFDDVDIGDCIDVVDGTDDANNDEDCVGGNVDVIVNAEEFNNCEKSENTL